MISLVPSLLLISTRAFAIPDPFPAWQILFFLPKLSAKSATNALEQRHHSPALCSVIPHLLSLKCHFPTLKLGKASKPALVSSPWQGIKEIPVWFPDGEQWEADRHSMGTRYAVLAED